MSADQVVCTLGIGNRVMIDPAYCDSSKDMLSRFGKILVKYISSGSLDDKSPPDNFHVNFIVVSVIGGVYTVPASGVILNETATAMIVHAETQLFDNNLLPYLGCFSHISMKDRNESS